MNQSVQWNSMRGFAIGVKKDKNIHQMTKNLKVPKAFCHKRFNHIKRRKKLPFVGHHKEPPLPPRYNAEEKYTVLISEPADLNKNDNETTLYRPIMTYTNHLLLPKTLIVPLHLSHLCSVQSVLLGCFSL